MRRFATVAFGTKRTRSRISPRSGVEGRPEVVGAVQNDEIDPTWKSRIRRNDHKSRAPFTVDDRDRFRVSEPSASMSHPTLHQLRQLRYWCSGLRMHRQ